MPNLLEAQARGGHRLWLHYDDGAEGEIDISDFVGHGVFATLLDAAIFARVHVGPSGQIMWNVDQELCADAMYLRLTRRSPEEIFPGLRGTATSA